MVLENWGRQKRPLFLTWTFRPTEYVDNPVHVLRCLQLTWKRLRRAGHDLRYFSSIERGKRNGRLHAHSILWSDSVSALGWSGAFWELKNAWAVGGIKFRQVYSPGAFHYTAKYLVKDLLEQIDRSTGEVITARNYQWSNRPGLGSRGIERWRFLADKAGDDVPVNWFHMPFLGKLERAYIPSDPWKKYVKKRIVERTVAPLVLDPWDFIPEQAVLYEPDVPVTTWINERYGYIGKEETQS